MKISRKKNQSDDSMLAELLCFISKYIHRLTVWILNKLGCYLNKILDKLSWFCKFGLIAAFLGSLLVDVGCVGLKYYMEWGDVPPRLSKILIDTGILELLPFVNYLAIGFGFLLIISSFLAIIRHNVTLLILKIGGIAFSLIWILVLYFIVRIPALLYLNADKLFDKLSRNAMWLEGVCIWMLPFILSLVFLTWLNKRSVKVYYARKRHLTPMIGDKIIDELQSHGKDPSFRISNYWSLAIHIAILIIYPLILLRGCGQNPYGIPKGSGTPVAQLIKVKKIKKKPKEQFVFNPNSAISYYRPDIDDSKVMEEVETETLNTYTATSLQSGKLGKGGGKKGGWPNGMENSKIRFIRLRYAGGDWDQQMGKGSDYNFLIKFKEYTGFNIASSTEAVDVRDLKRFPKHKSPPFVYITGQGNIIMSTKEIRTLKWYLLEEGGMIFADNGGHSFNSSFRSLMLRILPDKKWVDIPNDDIIYRQPYLFSKGAPPLWHHSGNRALGLKHNGRWVVFYHQGDINDAWQTGASGVSESIRSQAFKMGINVVNYSFNQYLAIHYEQDM